ncbi:hypothetical protein LCGC14_2768420 [marine sediment metagenome]|uniref:Uncharacterized protein n=1 Tax=marine sediment metagenome TaxID=412755 RepID=A0A0F8ZIT0_9ZZZZ
MKKVIFNLTEEQDARLAKTAKRAGVSKSEFLRRALMLDWFLRENYLEGYEIVMRKNGDEKTLVILGVTELAD